MRQICSILLGILLFSNLGIVQAQDITLSLNDEPLSADLYVKNGNTKVEAGVMEDMLEAEFESEYVSLRNTLEKEEAKVDWNSEDNTINVTMSDNEDELTQKSIDEITDKAREYLIDKNSLRLTKSYELFQDWLQNTWEGNWQTDEWDFFKGQTNLTQVSKEWLIFREQSMFMDFIQDKD
ncbi:hypothetical protein [Natranaerobius trueperi]|uniref:Copper amine oxidase-like N-terminal domain-containing protein n=1 Tax=Natranaerobius trueperi TaxID=759412 RepID=A0A226BZN9_9FIRM|nr:hypothetical protein [Natranaerobius trueperi]OWZ84391.1 hypothetical protein CDO51_03770 [Natranaerobius trueperi]